MKKSIINIGLIGFGTIGSGVVKVLQEKAKFFEEQLGLKLILKWIVDKDITTKRDVAVNPSTILSTNPDDILKDEEIDVVIELMGGYEPARTFILTALRQGKNVITANKALLAKYWDEIFLTANECGTQIYFEASVGGGIPIISSIRKGLIANRITSIFGIINGTCNFILTKMEDEDKEFNQALKEAKKSGFAEADPALDIEGIDTSHKLTILSSLAFNQCISNNIYTEGITSITKKDILYARELGYAIKLLGIAKVVNDELEVRVHPTMIPETHLLSGIKGVYNAIYVVGDLTGPLMFYGQGAGKLPTSSAVISDLINLIQELNNKAGEPESTRLLKSRRAEEQKFLEHRSSAFCSSGFCSSALPPSALPWLKIKDMEEVRSKYYIRFSALDKLGVLAAISKILGEYDISIASVIQKERGEGKPCGGKPQGEIVPIIMLTHEAKEGNLKNALEKIDKLETIKDKSLVIRVEEME
ncbi:MAG: homoserine dehydrogenase [Nitrospirota bacterium]